MRWDGMQCAELSRQEEHGEIAQYERAVRELLCHALDAAESRERIAALAPSLDTEADPA